jgi:hypothetical protein
MFVINFKNKDESHNIMIYKENLVTIVGDYKNKIEKYKNSKKL